MSTPLSSAVASVPARRHPSLVDQVTDGLSTQIRSGSLAPGAMLPSVQMLSENWGVSRTVTREALARLSAEGLINSRQGLGVFVSETPPAQKFSISAGADLQDLKRILELRLAIETEATGFAAIRRGQADLQAMSDALAEMAASNAAGDVEASIEADMRFHRAICGATGNAHFDDLFVFLSQFFRKNISVSRRNSAQRQGGGADAQAEHDAIFRAIAGGDAVAARQAARRHVHGTGVRLGIAIETEATPSS